ncbi:MAG: ABC transporter permease subunit [Clostridia bacterium]|nr:ABC transporter permease subunit [Clostridia bacterium]
MFSKHFKKVIFGALIFVFWISVWQISSVLLTRAFGNDYFLPTPYSAFRALIKMMGTFAFYKAVIYSFLRVFFGVILGIFFGSVLAYASHFMALFRKAITPVITIIKATPVVTFITLLWILVSGNFLTVFIAFLMVMPIIWQNLLDGFDAVPKDLSEVCDVFEFSRFKRFKILTLPTLLRYFFPAVITSIGLAWKAEIAAEVIGSTKVSIGANIADARYALLTDEVFAWIIVIATFSISLEILTKRIIRRFKK